MLLRACWLLLQNRWADALLLIRVVLRLVLYVRIGHVSWTVLLRLWSMIVRMLLMVSCEMGGQSFKLEDFLLKRLDQRVVADLFLDQFFIHYLVNRVEILM